MQIRNERLEFRRMRNKRRMQQRRPDGEGDLQEAQQENGSDCESNVEEEQEHFSNPQASNSGFGLDFPGRIFKIFKTC